MLELIPVVDLEAVKNFDPDTVNTVGQAFRDIGFVFVRTPGTTEILPEIFTEFRKLFSLPMEVKRKYARPELFYQRGWTPPFTEMAIACRGKGLPDAKENWFIGPEIDSLESDIWKIFPEHYISNIWPEEVPGFKPAMRRLYSSLRVCGTDVLRAVAIYMGKPRDYFDEMTRDSPTVLRAIHYPPVRPEQVGKIVWGCMHTDINLATVLPASTYKGLWIRRRDGKWIPGNAPEKCVIAQAADMLQYLTAREFVSAWHEVRAPEHPTVEGRLSAALFIHARSDVVFDPGNKRFPPITAGDLLLKRLKEIGLA